MSIHVYHPPHEKLALMLIALRRWVKPYATVKDILHGEEWEVISSPWIEDGLIKVNIRKQDDPTTMITVNALALEKVETWKTGSER